GAAFKLGRYGIEGTLEHYLAPWRRFERDVFTRLEQHGFEWRTFNALSSPTLYYDLYDPELIDKTMRYLPRPVWRIFERILADHPHAGMRLDWFAGRNLLASRPMVVPTHG